MVQAGMFFNSIKLYNLALVKLDGLDGPHDDVVVPLPSYSVLTVSLTVPQGSACPYPVLQALNP
jgi:hypothetical protein